MCRVFLVEGPNSGYKYQRVIINNKPVEAGRWLWLKKEKNTAVF